MAQNRKFQGVQTEVKIDNVAGTISGSYRGTVVAVLNSKSGTVKLNSGGWLTATTKMRMKQFANNFCNGAFSVYQKKGQWFVSLHNTGEELEYFDGIEIKIS